MFERVRSWYRNRQQQQRRSERPRIILRVEDLEPRLLLAGDTYTWSPGNVNLLASNLNNWMKNGVQQKNNMGRDCFKTWYWPERLIRL